MTKHKTEVVYRIRKRHNMTPSKALEFAKSRLWWNVSLVFDAESDPRFYVWRESEDG